MRAPPRPKLGLARAIEFMPTRSRCWLAQLPKDWAPSGAIPLTQYRFALPEDGSAFRLVVHCVIDPSASVLIAM